MEKFPGRVAAASLVLTPQAVRDIRQLANRPEMRKALRAGQFDQLKKGLLAILPVRPGEVRSLATLEPLRNWIGRVRSRQPQPGCTNRSEQLAGLEVPPVLVAEAEAGLTLKPSFASRGWRKIKGVNSHLAAFLDSLLPSDEETEEEDILAGKL